jgi:hypothetical protein
MPAGYHVQDEVITTSHRNSKCAEWVELDWAAKGNRRVAYTFVGR